MNGKPQWKELAPVGSLCDLGVSPSLSVDGFPCLYTMASTELVECSTLDLIYWKILKNGHVTLGTGLSAVSVSVSLLSLSVFLSLLHVFIVRD